MLSVQAADVLKEISFRDFFLSGDQGNKVIRGVLMNTHAHFPGVHEASISEALSHDLSTISYTFLSIIFSLLLSHTMAQVILH